MADFDADSTLIRRGRTAVTMKDMSDFVTTLEQRPIIVLLGELPALANLSENKFKLATKVLRRRFRDEAPIDQVQLRSIANEIAGSVTSLTVATRIRDIFKPEDQ